MDSVVGEEHQQRREKVYQTDLNQFQKFLLKKGYSLEVATITKIEVRDYLEAISGLKPKSIKRKIATIKAMFNYLEFDDVITLNPLRKMRIKIKEPKQLPRILLRCWCSSPTTPMMANHIKTDVTQSKTSMPVL